MIYIMSEEFCNLVICKSNPRKGFCENPCPLQLLLRTSWTT